MTEFNYSTSDITDDMPRVGVPNFGKYWSDKIEKDLLEKLAAIPSGHKMYLVAVPSTYEAMKMHVEPLDYPDTQYRFRMPFDYAPMYRASSVMLWGSVWDDPKVEPVVWREEPVVEAVPVWQYWVAAAVFAVILSMLGNVL